MKLRLSPIILSVLILSLALQTVALPVYAQSEPNQSQLEIEVPDNIPESRLVSYPDHRDAQLYLEYLSENMPPELVDLYQRHSESDEHPDAIPPSPEIIAKTQEQVNGFDCVNVNDVPSSECNALLILYQLTNGAGWTNNTNWLQTTTVSTWYGVTIEDDETITLNLTGNQLNGSLPLELGNLSNLANLSFFYNQLTGNIPMELGN